MSAAYHVDDVSVVLTAGVERRLLEPFTRAGVDVRQV